MIGASLYLVGKRLDTKEYEEGAISCQTCRKLIINSGIKEVIVRTNKKEYHRVQVEEWINQDDLLDGITTY